MRSTCLGSGLAALAFLLATDCPLQSQTPASSFTPAATIAPEKPSPAPADSQAAHQGVSLAVRQQTSLYLATPLNFEVNQGQAPNGYKFLAYGPSYALGIAPTVLALSLRRPQNSTSPQNDPFLPGSVDSDHLELSLVGTNATPEVTGLDPQPGRGNYFLGNDPAKWHTNVPHFSRVQISSVYQGIDLIFHGNHEQLEYDFAVAPGADPDQIRLKARGAESVTIDPDGNAILHTSAGDVELKHPVAYQEVAGIRWPVHSAFQVSDGQLLRFAVGDYNHKQTLVIDPVLLYQVAYGGSNGNEGVGLTVDTSGNVYVTGNTCSSDFPSTSGNFETIHTNPLANACEDAFVTKLDPTASTLIFSDFIGGSGGASSGAQLAVDSSENVYVAGATNATDFPTVSNIGVSAPTQCSVLGVGYNCPDGFIVKLSPDGSQILFSSLLGGSEVSLANQVKLNPVTGDLDVLGATNSSNFMPAPTMLQSTFAGGTCYNNVPCYNGFLLGLNPATGQLRYGTFLGGTGNDWSGRLAFDTSGNIYVAGSAQPPLSSSLGAVTHTYAPSGGATATGTSLFVLKLNLSGTTLSPGYLTLVEGDADTGASSIAVDQNGNAYFGGGTTAQHLPVTAGVYQSTNKDTTATSASDNTCSWAPAIYQFFPNSCGTGLVGKLDATGALSFLTYLGGSSTGQVEALGLDSSLNLWLTGVTASMDFPVTANHYVFGAGDFLAEMSNDGKSLPFATFTGGPGGQSFDLFVDSSNNVYITGYLSSGTSTPGVYSDMNAEYNPLFVQKWGPGTGPSISVSTMSLNFPAVPMGGASAPQTISVQNTGTVAAEVGVQLIPSNSAFAADFLESSNCGPSLASAASCEITVTFQPVTPPATCVAANGCYADQPTASILVTTNAIQGPQTINLIGMTGIGPSIVVSPDPIVFPAQAAGTSSTPLYVSGENAGDSNLVVSNIALSGPNASDFQLTLTGVGGFNCVGALGPGTYCSLDVTFSPASTATGTRTATLTFTDTAGDSPQMVPVMGTVAGANALNLSSLALAPEWPVAFGTSGQAVGTDDSYLALQNPSATSIQITSLNITGPNQADFTALPQSCLTNGSPTLPITVAPGASCYVDVTFSPTSGASGTRSATLAVGTNPAISGLPTISLTGDAVTNSQPGMSFFVIPNPMNFGGLQVGETSNSESVLFTIYNNIPIPCGSGATTCGAPLIINSISPGLSDYAIVADQGLTSCVTFPATIPAGQYCDYAVSFTPTQAGPRNTTLTIQSNDPQGPMQLPVYGSGLSLALGEFLETALNFGNCAIAVACPGLTTTLVNEGKSNLTISGVSASSNFAVSANTCTGSLAPQATCTISVTFTPPTAGFFSGTLTITDNDEFAPQQSVALTGTGAMGSQLRMTPPTINFGNQTLNTTSTARTLTLTSTGDSAVTFPANPLVSSLDFILQSTTCTAGNLAPGSSCTASIQFRPTMAELVGYMESGTFSATDNASGSPQLVYMQGNGVQGTTAATTTTLVSSLNPSTAGQAVTFTATVTGPSGNTTMPTGSVNFLNGTAILGSSNLNASGVGTFSTSSLPAGSYSITAVYSGDSNFGGSTSNVVTQVVNAVAKAASTTMVISSANPSTVGQSVTFTATVTGPSGNTTVPTGSVNFLDGTATLGSGTLNGSGVATFGTTTLGAGSHSITAVYSGDSNFGGSTSNVVTQVVNAVAKAASTTMVISSANPSTVGQSVTFTATVTGPSGNTTVPTGSVNFLDGTATLGSGTLNGSGVATFGTTTLGAGSHSITAVYGGDSNFSGSTSNALTQVVNAPAKLTSTTAVASSVNPSGQGQSVTFTATVSGPTGNPTVPTGTVTFMDGTTTLGSGSLNGSAQGTYSTSSLSTGSHSITAVYAGDTNFAGSTSAALTQTVDAPSFTVSSSPATVTVSPGQSGTATITVTPQYGFNQQVSFACSGLPAASTCSFSPTTVTPNGNSAMMTTVTVATDVAMTPLHAPSLFERHGPLGNEGLLAIILLGLGGLVRSRGKWSRLLCAMVMIGGLGLVVAGCGGKSSSGSGNSNSTTPAGTSTITVTASAGSLTQNTSFTLTVQ